MNAGGNFAVWAVNSGTRQPQKPIVKPYTSRRHSRCLRTNDQVDEVELENRRLLSATRQLIRKFKCLHAAALTSAHLTLPTLTPGTRLGPYEILSALGIGGMGEVYRAHDPRLDRQVAIKLLPAETAADPRSRERLRREAMAVAALDHPYISKIFEIGEHGDALFLVMEYIAGETLHRRLQDGRLALPDALRVAGEIAEALQEAHRGRFCAAI